MVKYLKCLWILCLLTGIVCGMFFWLQKDKIGFFWEDADVSTKKIFNDVSFGFELRQGTTTFDVKGKGELLQFKKKEVVYGEQSSGESLLSFYVNNDDIKEVTESGEFYVDEEDQGKGKEGVTDTLYIVLGARHFPNGKEKIIELEKKKIKLKKEIRVHFVPENDNYGRVDSILYDPMQNEIKELVSDSNFMNFGSVIQSGNEEYYMYTSDLLKYKYMTAIITMEWGNKTAIDDITFLNYIYKKDNKGKFELFLTLEKNEEIVTGCADDSSLFLLVKKQDQYEIRCYDTKGDFINSISLNNNQKPLFLLSRNEKLLSYDGTIMYIFDAKSLKLLHKIDTYEHLFALDSIYYMSKYSITYQDGYLYIIEQDGNINGKPQIQLSAYDTKGNFFEKILTIDTDPNYRYPEEFSENREMYTQLTTRLVMQYEMLKMRDSSYISNYWIIEK